MTHAETGNYYFWFCWPKHDKKLLVTECYRLISLSTYTDLSQITYEPLSLWMVPNSWTTFLRRALLLYCKVVQWDIR